MGMGEGAAVAVECDENYRMDIDDLKRTFDKTEAEGRRVIAVVASAGTTATGAYDPLPAISDFCEERSLWFHIDGAHGAAAALSPRHRHLLSGAERADSIVWDLHKMMLMPSLLTAVVFKRKQDNYLAFSQKASYLFNSGAGEPWFDLGQRTLECTKQMSALKAYLSLQAYGSDFFASYIDYCFELTRIFAELLEASDDFSLAARPEANIICFRYEPAGVDEADLDDLQKTVRAALVRSGSFFIVQTELRGRWYLRCTVINPLTDEDDLRALMEEIRAIGVEITNN
jgi:L-2,4-diaminobutyrate decarboxylase